MTAVPPLLPGPPRLAGRIAARRPAIAFTYGLTVAENAFELLYPFAIGLAIDGLLSGQGWAALLPLAGIWLAHIVTGAGRELYDTRLFAAIHREVAGAMIVHQRAGGIDAGEVAARSVMAREAIEFFEREIPALITLALGLTGGLAMLFLYAVEAGAVMAGLLVPVVAIYVLYGRRALALSTRLNDHYEREVGVITRGLPARVGRYFHILARLRVRLSDLQVGAWTAVELLSLGAVMAVVAILAAVPGIQPGEIFAGLAYVLTILACLDQLPLAVERFARLVDIRRRIDAIAV